MTNGEMTDNVVSLNAATRPDAWRKRPLTDPVYQTEVDRLINRVWAEHLSFRDKAVLDFIRDMTVSWSRSSWLFTYRMFKEGVTATNGTRIRCGLGLGETQTREAIKALEALGMIVVNPDRRQGLTISLNLDWKPAMLPVSKKRRNADAPSEIRTPLPRKSEAPPHGNPGDYIEQHLEPRSERGSPAAAPPATDENSVFVPKDEKITQPAVRHRSRPAPRPQVDATGQIGMDLAAPGSAIVRNDPETAKRKAQAKTTAIRGRKDPRALEQTWTAAVLETFDRTVSCPAWTHRDAGMVKKAIAEKWDGDAPSLHDFFDFAVRDWVRTVTTEFKWMKKDPAPRTPTLSFFVSWWKRGFVPAWNVARLDRERDGLKDDERKRYHDLTKRQGKTHDEAMISIAEDRVAVQLRTEMDKRETEAKQMLRTALIAKAQADKTPRWSHDNPHPNSEIARRRRIEAATAAMPDTPIPSEFDFGPLPDWEEVHGVKPGSK